MTRRTLCHYARRAVVSRYLAAEILCEEELRIHSHRTGEDILSGQIDRDLNTLVHDLLIHFRYVVPVEIGGGR